MKKQFVKFGVIMLAGVLGLTACGEKNGTLKPENQSVEQQQSEQQTEQPSKDNGETAKVSKKEVDKTIAEFTSKYLEAYNQSDSAFIEVAFRDKNFLPQEIWDKIKVFGGQEQLEKPDGFYKLIINCDEDVLYSVNETNYENVREEVVERFRLFPGECFVIAKSKDVPLSFIVRAQKQPNFFAEKYVYENIEEESNAIHEVCMWTQERKPPLLCEEELYYMGAFRVKYKYGNIDLDGDGKNEKIYFWGDNLWSKIYSEKGEEKEIESVFCIDETTFNLAELAKKMKENGTDDSYYMPISSIEIIDIDETDDYKEIVLKRSGEWEAGGQNCGVFRYRNGELNYMGSMDVQTETIAACIQQGEKRILSTSTGGIFGMGSFSYQVVYELEGDKIVKKETDVKSMRQFNERFIAQNTADLNLYEKPDSENIVIVAKKGDNLLFLETDGKSYAAVKSFETGKIGYIRYHIEEEDYRVEYYKQPELKEVPFNNLPAWD